MSRRLSVRTAFGGLCIVLLVGFAIVVGYRPDLLPPSLWTPIEDVTQVLEPKLTIIGVGAALGIIGLLGSWLWRTTHRTTTLSSLSAETPDRDVVVTGGSLTAAFEDTRDGLYHPDEDSVATSLRGVVVAVSRQQFDDPDRAQRYVDDGEWTDDQVAAATLTATDSVDFSLLYRLYAWLYPDHAYAYRTQRTLRAVEATCAEELSEFSPPDRQPGRIGRLRALLKSASGGDRQ